MDRVFIKGLRADAVIGVHAWEREIRQTLVLDLELGWDNRPAAAGDDLVQALDYAAVSSRLLAHVAASRCLLIETLAEELAALLTGEFRVPWLRLSLAKPGAVPEAEAVGVVIERGEGHP